MRPASERASKDRGAPVAKGFFTQCLCLLTDGRTDLREIKAALEESDFEIVKQAPAMEDWRFGGPTLIAAFRPDVNGYVAIDVVNHPWPDTMGDPQSDAQTFAAWSMGNFGPLTFPGGLTRASQHAWAWQQGRDVAAAHRGFIRIRLSYAFGAKDDDPIIPDDVDCLAELYFVSRAVLAMLEVPGVLCYFNPNGEVLRDSPGFHQVWTQCEAQEKLPLLLWINIRFFNLNERLAFMDTVGNGQLDLPDVEAVFPIAKYQPQEVDYYLRNVTHYLLGLERPLQSGEDIDGPGESNLSWTTEALDQGAIEPPRQVVRLYPKANRKDVKKALAAVGHS
jgi:hypothetical protein